jgi:HlyD family secretion protein
VVNKKIKDAVMVAPTGGIISEKYFELGEAIPPLSPIVEIIEIRKVEVKIYISEKKLPEVKYGQEARVTVDGLEKELNGTLSWVSPKAEFTPKTILTPETRTSLVYAVKISVPNPEGILKHGMPVEVFLVE